MIKVNEIEYNNYSYKIKWGSFNVSSNGKSIWGKFSTSNDKTTCEKFNTSNDRIKLAPFIKFNIEDKIIIGLEFSYSKEMWENIKINEKVDMKKYLTDITYEDKKGWISLIIEEHNCYITKIEENIYKINLFVNSNLEDIKIELDVKVQFES